MSELVESLNLQSIQSRMSGDDATAALLKKAASEIERLSECLINAETQYQKMCDDVALLMDRAETAESERDKYAAGRVREFLDDAVTEYIDGYIDGRLLFKGDLEQFADKLEGVERKGIFG